MSQPLITDTDTPTCFSRSGGCAGLLFGVEETRYADVRVVCESHLGRLLVGRLTGAHAPARLSPQITVVGAVQR